MAHWFRTSIALLLVSIGYAAPPAGYYLQAEDKTGPDLRRALHKIIRGHTVIPYGAVRFGTADALYFLHMDPANGQNLILFYAARSESRTSYGDPEGWNHEHLWPNSYGLDGNGPEYSDLFNLRPEDATVNSARGNKYYYESGSSPAHPEAPLCSTDSNSWEPPEAVKGDAARSMFYMDVRYEGGTNEPDLILTDNTALISSATNFMGRLSTLLEWHRADPISAEEYFRNENIYRNYQHNRNPFIDNPEFVQMIWGSNAPRLRILRQANAVELSWPYYLSNAVLQAKTALQNPWEPVSATATNRNNARWVLWQGTTNQARFYRLKEE